MSLDVKLVYTAPTGKSVTFYTKRGGLSGLGFTPYGGILHAGGGVERGAKLTIITDPVISVKITNAKGAEEGAINYVDVLNSDWVYLAPGINELKYSSDEDSKGTRIEVHWGDWYLGVG